MWGSTFGGISALLIQNARVSTELELLTVNVTVNVELLSGIFSKCQKKVLLSCFHLNGRAVGFLLELK